MITVTLIVVGVLLYLIWKLFIQFLVEYARAGFYLGFDKIDMVYRPLSTYNSFYKEKLKFDHNFGILFEKVKKNPNIKIIFVKIFGNSQINIIDPQFIKKITFDFVGNVVKRQFLIFRDQISKGLLFAQGQQWKNSRRMLANLFHFDMLKSRTNIMQDVVANKIQHLDNIKPNLFSLGRSIGGQIVLKSLFGEEYYNVSFEGRTPYQEINQLMMQLILTSRRLLNLIRMGLGFKATRYSIFLSHRQRQVLKRLMTFEEKSMGYLIQQRQKYENKQQVAQFLKVYFSQENKENLQQAVHQLFLFLLAGEDTTGGLISFCLLFLGLYPKYQKSILEDVAKQGIQGSKQLNNFINEVNRKCVPLRDSSSRKVVIPFTIDGFEFKKNTNVTISYAHAMNNVKFWDDPLSFKPERFNAPLQNPNAFTPFSSGPRNCIGQHMAMMEIRIALVRILEKYQLEYVGQRNEQSINIGIVNIPRNLNGIKFVPKVKEQIIT